MHTDRFGNVWVTTAQADKLYKAAKKLLAECDELDGADLLPEEAKAIRKRMDSVRKVLISIEVN